MSLSCANVSSLHFLCAQPDGEVTERSKVQHWKCCELHKGSAGSNPALSANYFE